MAKLTEEQFLQKCKDVGAIFADEWTNNIKYDTKLRFQCPTCGNIFLRRYNCVCNRGQIECRLCSLKRRSQKLRLDIEDVKIQLRNKGFEYIEGYVDTKVKCYIKCKCGNIFKIKPNSILYGGTKSCGHCDDPKVGNRINSFIVTNVFPSKGSGCKVECICDCGNIWVGPFAVLKGENTKSCGHCDDPKVGDRFGDLIVINIIPSKSISCTTECLCKCGNIWRGRASILKRRKTTSCGHCDDPKIGDRFNKLVVSKVILSIYGGCRIEAVCDCGNIWTGKSNEIVKGHTKSCGHCNDPKIGDRFGILTVIKVIPAKFGGCSVECLCDCGNCWKGLPKTLRRGEAKSCGCIKSHGEDKIGRLLIQLDIKFKKEQGFDSLVGIGGRKLKYDFYLPDCNTCIEYNGEQHYRPIAFNGDGHGSQTAIDSLKKIKKHDKLKRKFCKDNGITLIEIKYTKFDRIEEILRKKLKLHLTPALEPV